MSTLVCRLSSLGDVVLASGVTGGIGEVHFLTRPRLHPLVARFQGVVATVDPQSPLPQTQATVDLQNSRRSRALLRGRSPSRVDSERPLRLMRVWAKSQRPATPVVERYADAAGVPVSEGPWIALDTLDHRIALVPGAAHATKRWPHFAVLRRALSEPVIWLGGPDEDTLLQSLAHPQDRCIAESGVERTLEALAHSGVVVGGDTGLMHLAAACGIPTVPLFGPTHPLDGFWSHASPPLHLGLPCSPCSKHGGPRCPLRDHACLQDLAVEVVVQAIQERRR